MSGDYNPKNGGITPPMIRAGIKELHGTRTERERVIAIFDAMVLAAMRDDEIIKRGVTILSLSGAFGASGEEFVNPCLVYGLLRDIFRQQQSK